MAHVFGDYQPIAGPPGEMFEKCCSLILRLFYDYHPIAGPPGEFFEISLYVKTSVHFGALRQNKRTFWTGIREGPRGSGAAKSEPEEEDGEEEKGIRSKI